MRRRGVVSGLLAVVTGGCTDRFHDFAASTPSDVDVRSSYVAGDVLRESASITNRSAEPALHAVSYRTHGEASAGIDTGRDTEMDAGMEPVGAETETFVDETRFIDDGGRFVLVVVQRMATPGIDLRLGSVSRVGRHALRIGVSEVGTPDDDRPVVHTLLVRLADESGTPERIRVSVGGDRASVTV